MQMRCVPTCTRLCDDLSENGNVSEIAEHLNAITRGTGDILFAILFFRFRISVTQRALLRRALDSWSWTHGLDTKRGNKKVDSGKLV